MCGTIDPIETTETLILMLSRALSQAQAIHHLAVNDGNLKPIEVLNIIEGMSGLLESVLSDAHERSDKLWLDVLKTQPEVQSKILEFQGKPL
ncbi:hypothetical protein [Ruegeria lacuscaerulensis]|uniref:hypothetical protein n=1 Tax=Ruegeria lacuscaerulensis TaxID=55218 RepID=UPI00148048AA|nr:hypothetical protein [Ruegeria lacuscaerulensis]